MAAQVRYWSRLYFLSSTGADWNLTFVSILKVGVVLKTFNTLFLFSCQLGLTDNTDLVTISLHLCVKLPMTNADSEWNMEQVGYMWFNNVSNGCLDTIREMEISNADGEL